MAGINKVMIIGRVGKDPESKTLKSGLICNLSVATSEKHKDEERAEWHKIICFGKLAEICVKYLTKGSQVYVEGKLQTRSWEGKDGSKRFSTEIVASQVSFLGGGKAEEKKTKDEPDGDPWERY